MLRRAFGIVAYLIGVTGAGVFMLYVLATGTGCVTCAEPPSDGWYPWLMNGALLLLFAVQHSVMARPSFKEMIVTWIPLYLERSVYVASSGVALLLLTFFWAPLPGEPLWNGPIWIVAISLCAIAGIGACSAWFDHHAFFGLAPSWRGEPETRGPLLIAGPYRFVRHPLMLGLLIALWAQPIMPRELLMLNAGMTIYVVVAIRLEERDLVRMFGVDYENYRNDVPMFIPWSNRWFPFSARAAPRDDDSPT